jgi:hypothetical protein
VQGGEPSSPDTSCLMLQAALWQGGPILDWVRSVPDPHPDGGLGGYSDRIRSRCKADSWRKIGTVPQKKEKPAPGQARVGGRSCWGREKAAELCVYMSGRGRVGLKRNGKPGGWPPGIERVRKQASPEFARTNAVPGRSIREPGQPPCLARTAARALLSAVPAPTRHSVPMTIEAGAPSRCNRHAKTGLSA